MTIEEIIAEVNMIEENEAVSHEEMCQARINALRSWLSSSVSPYGDWKNLKQLDTGEYTEEEMAEYREGRATLRAEIAKYM